MFPLLAATVDLRACATSVAVVQFAVQLLLILRVGCRLRFIGEQASGTVQCHSIWM